MYIAGVSWLKTIICRTKSMNMLANLSLKNNYKTNEIIISNLIAVIPKFQIPN